MTETPTNTDAPHPPIIAQKPTRSMIPARRNSAKYMEEHQNLARHGLVAVADGPQLVDGSAQTP